MHIRTPSQLYTPWAELTSCQPVEAVQAIGVPCPSTTKGNRSLKSKREMKCWIEGEEKGSKLRGTKGRGKRGERKKERGRKGRGEEEKEEKETRDKREEKSIEQER